MAMLLYRNNLHRDLHRSLYRAVSARKAVSAALARWFGCLLALLVITASVQADGLFDFQMKLAQRGNAEAQFKVGEMYETGFGVEANRQEAEKWITRAANKGHETARFKLLYWDLQKNGLNRLNQAGLNEVRAKAGAGNVQAKYYLGKMYAHGVGVKADESRALKWLNEAAFAGVLAAESDLVFVKDKQQKRLAAERARRAAEERKKAKAEADRRRQEQARKERARKAQLGKAQARKQASEKARQESEKQARRQREQEQRRLAEEKARQEAEAREQQARARQEAARREAEEARQRALLEQKRLEEERKRKTRFESDPCSGKLARFLSTCR